ncbi:predicted protein [Naegleria gruberi]|uniref:Predicted protein n=1 Tax=Naegleria gruberi TaxID=5762 RepID=D2V6B9_NAEGR|nr:uncharacterized protein NAEGRDRAFT_47023 [Naegleria gruberi]EFC47422.1 predicted protein [Naegleria gruberi]|eukprot:XP_002680166.1 predicted protein [Naegleria gruberi strain NEG-M]
MSLISDGFNSGTSARISYNLTAGAYVAAIYNFPTPLSFTKLTFAIRYACAQNVKVSFRLTDSTGQTFQMTGLNMPFESLMKGWSEVYFQPTNATEFWGGANDGIFHMPFKQFSIVLGLVEKISSTVGCLDFDNFYAMNETQPIQLNLTNRVAVPWPGDMLSKMGVCVHSANTAELDAAKNAGFSMIRIDLFWSWVESSRGKYVWTSFDSIVTNLKARNMTALFILTYNNDLYKDSNGGFNATTIEAFANYSRAAAKHFAGTGTKFEIYNEANGNGFTGATYAPLAAAAIKAVHEGDSNAKVSTSGLSGFDYNFLINELLGGAGQEADAIGLHPYGVGYKSGVGSMVDGARLYKSYVSKYLQSTRSSIPPVWDTEMGLTSTDYDPTGSTNGHNSVAMRIQANRAVERLLASMAVGFEMFQYYDLRNDGNDPTNREHNFGLLFNNYTEKPAFKSVKQLSKMVSGKIFDSFIRTAPSPLTAMRFVNENETLVIVFAQVQDIKAKIVLVQTPKLILDVFGNQLTASQNSLTVTDKDGAIYLLYDNEKVTPSSSSVSPKATSSSSLKPGASNRAIGKSTITSDSGVSNRFYTCLIACLAILMIMLQ